MAAFHAFPILCMISPMDSMSTPLSPLERIQRLASQSAVVVFSVSSSCCMCHVVKRLLSSMGVNPSVVELDQEIDGSEMENALMKMMHEGKTCSGGLVLPAVFVGGNLVGGLESLMGLHINGSLVPMLKEAGALWL